MIFNLRPKIAVCMIKLQTRWLVKWTNSWITDKSKSWEGFVPCLNFHMYIGHWLHGALILNVPVNPESEERRELL